MDPSLLSTYVSFNRLEACLWFGFAGFLRRHDREVGSPVVRNLLPALFVLFGLTDLLEAEVSGALPPYLWWSKLLLGTSLFLLANYRDHVAFGNLGPRKLFLRVSVFGLLLAWFLRVTTG